MRLFRRQFSDGDEATQFMSAHRDYRVLPLSPAPFNINLYQIDLGALVLTFVKLQTSIQMRGERRPGFISFSLPLVADRRPSYLHEQPFDQNTLAGFDTTRSVDSFYQQNMQLSALQVRQDLFEATQASMRRDDLDEHFFKQDLIHLPRTLSVYRSYMQELMQLVKWRSPLLEKPDYHQMIIGDVVPLLIDTIPRRKPEFRLPPHPRRQVQLANQARDYIAAHLQEALTLKDLYTTLGVSLRTLFYSFESTFGVTPMEYIKPQRLHGARQLLKQADPNVTSVVAVANQWGFWHSGQFAKAYQTMFGELPSETLKTAKRGSLTLLMCLGTVLLMGHTEFSAWIAWVPELALLEVINEQDHKRQRSRLHTRGHLI